jgi:hypothetical protein
MNANVAMISDAPMIKVEIAFSSGVTPCLMSEKM